MGGKDKAYIKQTPGPGSYSPANNTVQRKAAQFSMGTGKNKDSFNPANNNPGAGSYHNKIRKKVGPSFGFGSAPRMKEYGSGTPVPGHYKVTTKIRDTGGFQLQKNELNYV